MVQTRFDRAQGHARGRRNLSQAKAFNEPQEQGFTMIFGQAAQCLTELGALAFQPVRLAGRRQFFQSVGFGLESAAGLLQIN